MRSYHEPHFINEKIEEQSSDLPTHKWQNWAQIHAFSDQHHTSYFS